MALFDAVGVGGDEQDRLRIGDDEQVGLGRAGDQRRQSAQPPSPSAASTIGIAAAVAGQTSAARCRPSASAPSAA